jgi:hypothetical protein
MLMVYQRALQNFCLAIMEATVAYFMSDSSDRYTNCQVYSVLQRILQTQYVKNYIPLFDRITSSY